MIGVDVNLGKDFSGVWYKAFTWKLEIVLMCIGMVLGYLWYIATCNLGIRFMIMCCVSTYYFNSDD